MFKLCAAEEETRAIARDDETNEAMEAFNDYQIFRSLISSEELVCECHLVSYQKIYKHLKKASEASPPQCPEDVLKKLGVAQGCGSCRETALGFVRLVKKGCKFVE